MPTVLHFQSSFSAVNRRIAEGVSQFAARAGWRLHVVPYANAAEKEDDLFGDGSEGHDLEELLAHWRPDGCLVVHSPLWPDLAARLGALPCVSIDNPAVAPSVCLDNAPVGRAAAAELLRLDLAAFAFASLQHPKYWCRERTESFAAAIREHGFEPMDLGTTGESAGAVSEQFVETLRRLPKPCGLFAMNDDVARRALDAAAVAGLAVPYDFVVVGADDDESLCEGGAVTLTSVRPDFEGLGHAAAQELARHMERPDSTPRRIRVGGATVTRRASSRRLLRRDAVVAEVLEDIRLHYADSITAASLATSRNLCLRTLERRFLKAKGRTIGREIADTRFNAARRMLAAGGSRSVEAVANLCGYDSDSTLRKAFRARLGLSPRTWRAMQREHG